MNKQLTLCIVQKGDKILLGMKKRGFGIGRWNGFGGKVQSGESVDAAARREIKEEAGIIVGKIHEVGVIDFDFIENPGVLETHVFKVVDFTGEPAEGEEMRPRWFNIDEIPYDEMWPDDRHWLPLLLSDKKFRGRFLFGPDDTIVEQVLEEV